jgi:hypothetical protein
MNIKDIISNFDVYLAKRNLHLEGVVIGGAALNLLGIVSRFTRDCDILDPEIPKEIIEASVEFSAEQNKLGSQVAKNWLNNGPISLKSNLPSGWEKRLTPVHSGKAIALQCLGRPDLLKTKLYAYCDRQTDKDDCLALSPNQKELAECLEWVKIQDTNQSWPSHVEKQFNLLAKELGHGV